MSCDAVIVDLNVRPTEVIPMIDHAVPWAGAPRSRSLRRDRAHVPAQPDLTSIPTPSAAHVPPDGADWRPPTGAGSGDTMYWVYPAGSPLHARQARTWLSAYLGMVWNDAEAVFMAETAASEVLTNASKHGIGLVTVAVRADAHRVLLEVGDDSPLMPVRRAAQDEDECGRGLQIVDAIAECWCVRPRVFGGKVVQVVLASGA